MIKNVTYLILVLFVSIGIAQEKNDLSYYLPSSTSYDTSIPTPQSVLGYNVGKWHVTHDKLVSYLTILANSSDRIQLENRGTSFEDRSLQRFRN